MDKQCTPFLIQLQKPLYLRSPKTNPCFYRAVNICLIKPELVETDLVLSKQVAGLLRGQGDEDGFLNVSNFTVRVKLRSVDGTRLSWYFHGF